MGPHQAQPVSPTALTATLPSPASVSDPLDIEPSRPSDLRQCKRVYPHDIVAVLPPEPGHVEPPAVDTPLSEFPTQPDLMNLIVGGALAPMSSPPTRPQHTRPSHDLRLPSFLDLGIEAPHPDRFGTLSFHDTMPVDDSEDVSPLHHPAVAAAAGAAAVAAAAAEPTRPDHLVMPSLQALNVTSSQSPEVKLPSTIRHASFPHDVATLTPPAETEDPLWKPSTGSTMSISIESLAIEVDQIVTSPVEGAPHDDPTSPPPTDSAHHSPCEASETWIHGALQVLRINITGAASTDTSIRVLSHALPSPSPTGHIYASIINAILGSTPSLSTTWINVFHAIPGRFNLEDLPTSPPSTPGPPVGGDDYFTQKIFDTAVRVSDYQQDLSSLPRSPRPVVPPKSVDLAVVERYIPPSSVHEFLDMFEPSGPSILVDRLAELSPNNGSLVFVYPTQTGAKTFVNDYLGPILDPILRWIQVEHGMPSGLGRTLGTMVAVNSLLEFEQMRRSMQILCRKLHTRGRGSYACVHASRTNVPIEREAWLKDWWMKQEKAKIRDTITKYSQEAQKKKTNVHVARTPTPTELVQQLMDGVTKKSYPSGQEPTVGIECSVFVIQRSA